MKQPTAVPLSLPPHKQVIIAYSKSQPAWFRTLTLTTIGGHLKGITSLVQHGASIDRENKHGRTALIVASSHGRTAAVRTLLQLGAYPNSNPNHKHYPDPESPLIRCLRCEMHQSRSHSTDRRSCQWPRSSSPRAYLGRGPARLRHPGRGLGSDCDCGEGPSKLYESLVEGGC